MGFYQGHPFLYSEPLVPIVSVPERFYSSIPVRVSKYSDSIQEAAEKAREDLVKKLGVSTASLAANGTITQHGHVVSWAFPECPSSWISFLTELIEFGVIFDDLTDSLDKNSGPEPVKFDRY
ncbi:Geranylgeranyl pyrophosphate synthase [Penicillium angulare]|uniref:Geranylgeranyl pyrophosphate synthase n=1 Tax=Penicillium angulare TaxID=116970 RepID=A0A9W9FY21_9EURO|nr:Geranylgeranyl pyrophosphate synthase [Penicillium angulare]